MIMRVETRTCVNHENHNISFSNRLLGLTRHLMKDARFGYRFKASGIYNNKRRLTNATLAIVPIPGQSGKISD
jgi:hypothetical protein